MYKKDALKLGHLGCCYMTERYLQNTHVGRGYFFQHKESHSLPDPFTVEGNAKVCEEESSILVRSSSCVKGDMATRDFVGRVPTIRVSKSKSKLQKHREKGLSGKATYIS